MTTDLTMAHSCRLAEYDISQIPEDQLGIIYMITNEKTELSYIGRTMRGLEIRWDEHIEDAFAGSNTQFHHAIREYEIWLWHAKIIESDIPECYLRQREAFWIDYHNTYFHGYNSRREGRGYYVSWKQNPSSGDNLDDNINLIIVEDLANTIVTKWKGLPEELSAEYGEKFIQ